MVPKANSLTDRHLSLLQAYFLVLQRVDRFPWLVWVPTGWLGLIRVPVLTLGVRILVSSHIKRVLKALERAYQRRLAIDEPDPAEDGWKNLHQQADWKKLQEQAEAMDASLPSFLIQKWAFAALAFFLVFLVVRGLPQGDLVIKMAGAVATVNFGKLAELAAEPGALDAFARLIFVLVMMFITLTPVLIYHFRFKRVLFNRTELPAASNLNVTLRTVWAERSISVGSLYVLERDVFVALGDPALPEIPFDLLAVVITFLYHAIGPGLVVGIFAWQVFAVNRSTGRQLFFVAATCGLIGLGAALISIENIRQRLKELAAA
ncbi:MAG: hypothetical protein P4K94_04905 [Terracidiphilus sp.]|nr:hypothetical protein [Terracidiphilus sp.]